MTSGSWSTRPSPTARTPSGSPSPSSWGRSRSSNDEPRRRPGDDDHETPSGHQRIPAGSATRRSATSRHHRTRIRVLGASSPYCWRQRHDSSDRGDQRSASPRTRRARRATTGQPGGAVKRLVVGAALAALAWIAAPWVAMARRGTLDDQARAAMREPVVPRPRRPVDDTRIDPTEKRRESSTSPPDSSRGPREPHPPRWRRQRRSLPS